jgi:osmotically-inducible protein OsmY
LKITRPVSDSRLLFSLKEGFMKILVWLIPIVIAFNVVVAGCDKRDRQPGTRSDPSPSRNPSVSTNDSDLENAVRAKLANDGQLKEADLSVIAIAERNEITLSGTVRTRAAREKAIELAKSAKPGVAVNDKIEVKPGA